MWCRVSGWPTVAGPSSNGGPVVDEVNSGMRPVEEVPRPVPLRRNRDFTLLWTGQVCSELGASTSQLAIPLLVLGLTGSPTDAGLVGTVALVVGAVARLPGGAVADRWDRRRLMLASDGARLVASAGLAVAVVTGWVTVPLVVVVVAVTAVFDVVFSPAETASVPRVVPAVQLAEAFARNEARTYVVTLAGPPLGGLLYGVGRAVPFVADTVSYLVSLLTVAAIRSPLQDRPGQRPPQRLGADIREGVAQVLASPFLRALLVVAAPLNLAIGGALFTTTITLRLAGTSAGLVGAAQGLIGAGGLLGAFAAASLQRRVSIRGLVLGVTVGLTVALAAATVLAGHLVMAVPIAVGLFLAPSANVVLFARLAATTPDHIQARVISVVILAAGGASALAPLLGDVLITQAGGRGAMSVWTAVVAIAVLAAAVTRGLRAD